MNILIRNFTSPEILELALNHKCVRCGKCCQWEGNVFLYSDDIQRISQSLHISHALFLCKYCYLTFWTFNNSFQYRVCLKKKELTCIFLRNNLCTIHNHKPLLCKAGPFSWHWITNKKIFQIYYRKCPGFNSENKVNDIHRIDKNFVGTWKAEINAFKKDTIELLSEEFKIPKDVLESLPKVKLKAHHSRKFLE